MTPDEIKEFDNKFVEYPDGIKSIIKYKASYNGHNESFDNSNEVDDIKDFINSLLKKREDYQCRHYWLTGSLSTGYDCVSCGKKWPPFTDIYPR